MLNVAVVGTGYWGKNLVRTFHQLPDSELSYICDSNVDTLRAIGEKYHDVTPAGDYELVLDDDKVNAVVIATSATSHFALAEKALLAGKHVFVEKPLALNLDDAHRLNDLAKENNLTLMVDHLMQYHPAITKLKELIDSGELGDIFYLYSQRVNLGRIRKDENALWSLAPHDISMVLYLMDEYPNMVSACGGSFIQKDVEDVIMLTLHFPSGKLAHAHVSWLDPHKVRTLTVVGSKKMATFDDMEPTEKLRIYDKGADMTHPQMYESYGDAITIFSGDIHIPKIDMVEPLRAVCQHFIDSIRDGKQPLSNGEAGIHVLQVLDAAQRALDSDTLKVELNKVAS